MADENADNRWEQGWEGHRDAQRRRLAQLSLVEKLAWLEAAQETVMHLSAQSRKQRDSEGIIRARQTAGRLR